MGLGKRERPRATIHHIEDTIEAVAEFLGREKVTATYLWGFEGAEITQLAVWGKPSHCSIVLTGYPSTFLARIKEMGWPDPPRMGRDLPRAAGLLYEHRWPPKAETSPDDDEALDEAPKPLRVRRTRAVVEAPAEEPQPLRIARVRRTRVA